MIRADEANKLAKHSVAERFRQEQEWLATNTFASFHKSVTDAARSGLMESLYAVPKNLIKIFDVHANHFGYDISIESETSEVVTYLVTWD